MFSEGRLGGSRKNLATIDLRKNLVCDYRFEEKTCRLGRMPRKWFRWHTWRNYGVGILKHLI